MYTRKQNFEFENVKISKDIENCYIFIINSK